MNLVIAATRREPDPMAIATSHSGQDCGLTLKTPGTPCMNITYTMNGAVVNTCVFQHRVEPCGYRNRGKCEFRHVMDPLPWNVASKQSQAS